MFSRSFENLKLILPAILFALALSACEPETPTGPGPRAWIDLPTDGETVELGTVIVTSHSSNYIPMPGSPGTLLINRAGITRVELVVNGAAVRADLNPDPDRLGLVRMDQPWTPPGPGDYGLVVRATNRDGVSNPSLPVRVRVGSATPTPVGGCAGTPNITSFTASSLSVTAGASVILSWGAVTNADSVTIDQGVGAVTTPGSVIVSPTSTTIYTMTARCGRNTQTRQVTILVATPTPTATRTRGPAELALTPTPTTPFAPISPVSPIPPPIPTTAVPPPPPPPPPPAPPQIQFYADSTSLQAGQCTTLHWRTQNVQAVYLNNQGVVGNQDLQVCPGSTTTYNLRVDYAGGSQTRQVTIQVSVPPATATRTRTPPTQPAQPPAAPSGLQITHDCSGSTHKVTPRWNDNSNNESGFRIYRGGSQVAQVSAGVTSYLMTMPVKGNTYTIGVAAYNSAGTSASISASAAGCPD